MPSNQDLRDLVLNMLPSDGSAMGNIAILAKIRSQYPEITDEEYWTARDSLVSDGLAAKGRGRGGALSRILVTSLAQSAPNIVTDTGSTDAGNAASDGDDDEEPEDEDGFTLAAEAPQGSGKRPRKARSRKGNGPLPVVSYRHAGKRVNNPEVGIVHPENDPDGPKKAWAYDPHLDPALQFDIGRGRIEALIDGATADRPSEKALDALLDDIAGSILEAPAPDRDAVLALLRQAVDADRQVHGRDRMMEALSELRRLQAPYLTWTGKAERTSFQVDTVSLHVHERIDPASILRAVKKRAEGSDGAAETTQFDLFAPAFEKKPLREALDFYKHDRNWSNRLIAGDSLLVMNSLLQKEGMRGQVQMVYLDPPYGIKYGSNFQPFTNKREVKDGSDDDLTQEPETIKAFRDTWELGIHSYLTYLRDRLRLAWELLHESGSVFVQIGDENVHRVRALLEEIFGEDNFVSQITFRTTSGLGDQYLDSSCNFLIWYAKSKDHLKYRQLYKPKLIEEDVGGRYRRVQSADYVRRAMTKAERSDTANIDPTLRIYRHDNLTSQSGTEKSAFPIAFNGVEFKPVQGFWKTNNEGLRRLSLSNRTSNPTENSIQYVRFFDDFAMSSFSNVWTDTQTGAFTESKMYVVQTNAKVIERCVLMTTDPGDLVFDPTCGSGTTAVVAEKWGRRWITCDTSRVAITLTKQRLMTAGFDYYVLRYPHEGLKGGFVYDTLPHVTLKSIANNPDIDTIHAQMHPAVETARTTLNKALAGARLRHRATKGPRAGQWIDFSAPDDAAAALTADELPETFPDHWPEQAKKPFREVRKARRTGGADRPLAQLNALLRNAPLRHRATTGARAGECIDFCAPGTATTNIRVTEQTHAWRLEPGDVAGPMPEDWPAELAPLWTAAVRDNGKLAELNTALRGQRLTFTTQQGWKAGREVRFDAPDDAKHYRIVDCPVPLNALLEWEIPFDFPEHWPDDARDAFDAFHGARVAMQERIDTSISDHAEPETLYNQPEDDPDRLRVTGPFTVEAVPAPAVLPLDEQHPPAEADVAVARSGETSRQAMWRDELLKTGIRAKGGSVFRLADLEAIPGLRHLHATGSMAETGDRVVVSFGPEHAALEQRQVEMALAEAETLRPAPKFVVFCAFTFDPEAAKDIDEVNWPGVKLLKAQMNTDLLTEDLKKARSSNESFWLMGQPDIDVRKRKDGLWEVEVNGFDYFDPLKGELKGGGKKNIAMWALDTDYDQRSLFPHQVFFPIAGPKEGWNRLRKTIRAELDEDLLEQFHGTVSLPFEAGENRRIAVKIVDDRGIESLRIKTLDE